MQKTIFCHDTKVQKMYFVIFVRIW